MKTLSHLVVAALLLATQGLYAQTVYRCGSSYSQTPCPGGNTVDATDSRTPEQRKAHEAGVKQEKRAGDNLEKTRMKEEAAVQRETERADKAQRDADKAAQKSAAKQMNSQEKVRAYRAPEKK
ncbi:MAG: hypothetical protein KGL73_08860 [Burkholderiales bacterium]|nr:hypothetical protein [Burkholderiales bacterium]